MRLGCSHLLLPPVDEESDGDAAGKGRGPEAAGGGWFSSEQGRAADGRCSWRSSQLLLRLQGPVGHEGVEGCVRVGLFRQSLQRSRGPQTMHGAWPPTAACTEGLHGHRALGGPRPSEALGTVRLRPHAR